MDGGVLLKKIGTLHLRMGNVNYATQALQGSTRSITTVFMPQLWINIKPRL